MVSVSNYGFKKKKFNFVAVKRFSVLPIELNRAAGKLSVTVFRLFYQRAQNKSEGKKKTTTFVCFHWKDSLRTLFMGSVQFE